MPLMKNKGFTSKDYWSLPDGKRAELIDGTLYDMAPPSFQHQKLSMELSVILKNHIIAKKGSCEVISAPFAVNLFSDDETWVEPDISVICDKSKITDRGCNGAPDLIIEIVSPSSRRIDYNKKNGLYRDAGVREYWIIDPDKERVTIYRYVEDEAPVFYPFDSPIEVKIFSDLSMTISELMK